MVTEARDVARSVLGTPFAMARPRLRSGQMSVHMLSLGRLWMPHSYRYVETIDGVRVPPIPDSFHKRCHEVLEEAGKFSASLAAWSQSFRAEAALVNYYPPGSSMGMHQDANEQSEAPVISLSIGDTALFRLGGTKNRNRPWHEIPLLSGDAIVFGGAHRRAFHGVPRVEEGTSPEECGVAQGRINITIRQIDL